MVTKHIRTKPNTPTTPVETTEQPTKDTSDAKDATSVETTDESVEITPNDHSDGDIDNDQPVVSKEEVEAVEAVEQVMPKQIRDADVASDHIDVPTGTTLRPPMNPFMVMEQQRNKDAAVSSVPNADDMKAILLENGFRINDVYTLSNIHETLSNYIVEMAPNTPKSPESGSRYQLALADVFFTSLSAAPDVSLEALRLLETYFQTYNGHALARSHVFRFMDVVRLSPNNLRAFQSLLHLFVELGTPDSRTRKEVAREVNITQIADALTDNSDAQARLVEFMAS